MIARLQALAAVARAAERTAYEHSGVQTGLDNDAFVARSEYRAALRAFDAMLWGSDPWDRLS